LVKVHVTRITGGEHFQLYSTHAHYDLRSEIITRVIYRTSFVGSKSSQ